MTALDAATLRRAADLLDEHGWTQDAIYRRPDGEPVNAYWWEPGCAMCAIGAIMLAARPLDHAVSDRALLAVSADINTNRVEPIGIPSWNDAPSRTAEQVTAQLRATADRLDREEANQ